MDKQQLKYIIAGYENQMFFYDIIQGKLGPAKQPSKEFLNYLRTAGNDGKKFYFKSYIPENVLRFETMERYIMWYVPPKERKLTFINKLGIKTGSYRILPMVFIVEDSKLYVYATKGNPRTKPQLYQAPFLNVNSSGNVCLGSAKLNKDLIHYEDIIKDAENKFFNSEFTHTNTNILLDKNKSIIDYYQKTKMSIQPLIPIKYTIHDYKKITSN